MRGLYPALTRVCLWMLGPYDNNASSNPDTARGLINRDFYSRATKLPQLAKEKPEKIKDYLPSNISLDADTETLTLSYRLGDKVTTALSTLTIAPVSLEMEAVNIQPSPPVVTPEADHGDGRVEGEAV